MIRAFLLVLTASTALCAGCQADSCTIDTSDLSMVAIVTDTAGTIRARVDFAWGDRGTAFNEWSKCDGDVVQINGEDAEETERDDRVEYSITIDAEGAPRSFTFMLDREKDDETVEASLTLPDAFDIVAPSPNEEVSRATDLVLEWAPPAPDQELQIQLFEEIGGGVCLRTDVADHDYKMAGGARVPDTGRRTIPANVVASDDGNCEAAYQLQRFSQGNYPGAIAEGGFLEGRVTRNVTVISVP